jgi:hypothetical protein
MSNPNIPWPPRIGDSVGIKGSGLVGKVVNVQGSGDDQIFILHVQPPATADGAPGFDLARAAHAARTAYRLEELEQTTVP